MLLSSKLMMKRFVFVLPVLLAGCALFMTDMTGARKSWSGQRYADVQAQWGEPTRTERRSGGRVARTWVSEGRLSRVAPTFGIFGGSFGGGAGASVGTEPVGPQSRCERTLIFEGERVVKQEWQGDANYCSTFVRH